MIIYNADLIKDNEFENPLEELIVQKISKEEFEHRKGFINGNEDKDSKIVLADNLSQEKNVIYIELIDGTVLTGKSLGIEADFDLDNDMLGYDVLCFHSYANGGVYLIPNVVVEDVY